MIGLADSHLTHSDATTIDEYNVALDLVHVESWEREQALIHLFQHSTIRKADVKKLGLHLGVGWDKTQEIIDENSDTTMATVRTCCKWIEKCGDMNKVIAAKQLYKALQSIGHGRIARRLVHCSSTASTLSGKQTNM